MHKIIYFCERKVYLYERFKRFRRDGTHCMPQPYVPLPQAALGFTAVAYFSKKKRIEPNLTFS